MKLKKGDTVRFNPDAKVNKNYPPTQSFHKTYEVSAVHDGDFVTLVGFSNDDHYQFDRFEKVFKFNVIYKDKVINTITAEDADAASEMVSTMYPDNSCELTIRLV